MEQHIFNDFPENILVCIKDNEDRVLYQNKSCKETCGANESEICREGCMKLYQKTPAFPTFEEGVQFFPSQVLKNGVFDIVMINDKKTLTSILYPLEEKHREELELLSQYDLSKRESEIMKLVVLGATNNSICKKLSISRATLKTHLNNVYKKLPNPMCERFKKRGN